MERQISESCIDDIAQRVANILFEDEVDEGIVGTVKDVIKGMTPEKKKFNPDLRYAQAVHRLANKSFPSEKYVKKDKEIKSKVLDRLRAMGYSNPEAHEIYDTKMNRG